MGLDEGNATERAVADYLENYLAFYREAVLKLAPGTSKENCPVMFAGAPYMVKAYVLPNRAVCAIFKYNAKDTTVEVTHADYSTVRLILEREPHNNLMLFRPFKVFTKEAASSDANGAAERDLHIMKHSIECSKVASLVGETQVKFAEIAKTNPWLEKQFKLMQDAMAKVKSSIDSINDALTKTDTDEKYGEYDSMLALVERIKMGDKKERTDAELEKYVKSFIKAYRDIHLEKTSKTKVKKLTPLYAGYPYTVNIATLPNGISWFLFKHRASALSIESKRPDVVEFEARLLNKDYDYFIVFPPGKDISEPEKDAKAHVEHELAKFDVRTTIDDCKLLVLGVQKKTQEMMKTNPWLDKQFKVVLDALGKVVKPLDALASELAQMEKEDVYADAQRRHVELMTQYPLQVLKGADMKVVEINLAEMNPSEEEVVFEETEEEAIEEPRAQPSEPKKSEEIQAQPAPHEQSQQTLQQGPSQTEPAEQFMQSEAASAQQAEYAQELPQPPTVEMPSTVQTESEMHQQAYDQGARPDYYPQSHANGQSYSTETVPPVQEYAQGKVQTFRVENPYANLPTTSQEEASAVLHATLSASDLADINALKSKLFQQEKKLSDFQRKLDYMEKYMEKLQETQNKKFDVMDKLIDAKVKHGRYNGVIIATIAIALAAFTAILVLFPGTIPLP